MAETNKELEKKLEALNDELKVKNSTIERLEAELKGTEAKLKEVQAKLKDNGAKPEPTRALDLPEGVKEEDVQRRVLAGLTRVQAIEAAHRQYLHDTKLMQAK